MYIIRNTTDAKLMSDKVPERVLTELIRGAAILESEYDDYGSGGYSVVIQSQSDLDEVKRLLNYSAHICEWATHLGSSGYLSAFYILNNDFSVVLYMPIDIAPDIILNELED